MRRVSPRMMLWAVALTATAAPVAAGPTVYVPLGSSNDILVLDAETDRIVESLVGAEAVHGLGGTLKSDYVVAGSYSETMPGQAPSARPEEVPEDEHAAHHAAPADPAPQPAVGLVSVFRRQDGTVVCHIEVPGAVHHVAVTPDGRHAIATLPNAAGVAVIDLQRLVLLTTVPTGPGPNYAVPRRDGRRVYVSNAGNGTVSEIDTETWIVRRNLLAGDTPEHLVLAADDRTLYVNNAQAGTVSEIALAGGEVVRSFTIGGELHGLDLSDDGRTLFVSSRGESKLAAVVLAEGQVHAVPLGPEPYHVAVIPGTGKLYVSSHAEPKMWVVDQNSLTPQATIPIRGEGHQMVVLD